MALQQGTIVWVEITDPENRNPKCRPAVIVTPTGEIEEDATLVVVAATSTITDSLPKNIVELPWHADKHPKTGLYRRCVVICDWLKEVHFNDIKDAAGKVPGSVLRDILEQLPPLGESDSNSE